MQRSKVNTYTRRAQIGGVALLLLSTGLAVAPGSWASAWSRAEAPAPAPAPVTTATAPKVEPVDAVELASLLAIAAPEMPREDPPAPAVAEAGPGKGETAAPPPPPPRWRYIGSILAPTWKRAIVVVGEQQKMVLEGDAIDDKTTVVAIASDHLLVRENGVEREEALAPRQAQPEGAKTAAAPGDKADPNNPAAHGGRSVPPRNGLPPPNLAQPNAPRPQPAVGPTSITARNAGGPAIARPQPQRIDPARVAKELDQKAAEDRERKMTPEEREAADVQRRMDEAAGRIKKKDPPEEPQ
jgi:hypothetical protein